MLYPLIVPLDTIPASADVSLIGGKAAAVSRLMTAGFPVPPGLCLTTAAFALALAPKQAQIDAVLRDHDLHQPAAATTAAQIIADQLADLVIPTEIMAAFRAAQSDLVSSSTWLAVRSSATDEDRAAASLAGQYETVLGVSRQDEIALRSAILTCWRSFFSPNALNARAVSGSSSEPAGMALLIQPLIEAECAGVCYTVDPVQQQRDRMIIDAAWGLGLGVVDGSVAADTTSIRRQDLTVIDRHVVNKPEQIRLDHNGQPGLRPVPLEQQSAACLSDDWLTRIAQFGLAAERLFGQPQDLEWAIAAGQFYLLQSRPITALSPDLMQSRFPVTWESASDQAHLWTLNQPEGQEPAVMYPLEQASLAAVEDMREETCRFMGADRNQAIRFINGRAYTRPIPLPISDSDRRLRQTAMNDLKDRLHQQGWTAWDYWGPEIVQATTRLRVFDPTAADGPALADHLEEALAARRRHYMLHPLCWFKPRPAYFEAFAALTGRPVEDVTTDAYQLLDNEVSPLTNLVDSLYELARLAIKEPAVADLIISAPIDFIAQLRRLSQADAFIERLEFFLAIYGERIGDGYGSEATIRVPTWRERPEQFLPLIVPYLDSQITSPAEIRQRAATERAAQIDALCREGDDPAIVSRFRLELAYARRTMTVVEEHNHYIDQMSIGQLRLAIMAAAGWLVNQNRLTNRDDIFWLDFAEILTALRADEPPIYEPIITTRRRQYVAWEAMEPPASLGMPSAQLPPRPPWRDELTTTANESPNQLTGLGASAGRYRGRAQVVTDLTSLPNLSPGVVLVTKNVGPLWTPFFPILGGLIIDKGSLGQHAATTAREYGVPAVIATRHATQRIPDGAWVTLDGSTGLVEIEPTSADF